MNSIQVLTKDFYPNEVALVTRRLVGTGNLIGKVVKTAQHLRDQIIQNRIALIALVILSSGLFITLINSIANRLIDRDAIGIEERANGNKTFKFLWLSGTFVSLSAIAFSYACIKVIEFPLNRATLTAIAITAFIFHNLYGRERDFIRFIKK